MSRRPLKRQRSFSPLTQENKWDMILKKWTELSSLPTLFTQKGLKCLHFYVKTRNKTDIVSVRQIKSNGSNSDIYMIDFWENGLSVQQNVILKHCMKTDISTEIEAELQRWSWTNGKHAPRVIAYNHKAIISELCTSELKEEVLSKGFIEPDKTIGRLDVLKKRWVNTFNMALGPSSLRIIALSRKIYTDSGLYNRDPNLDNYMVLRGRDVQIDYGQERFHSEEQFTRWFETLPVTLQTDNLQELILEQNSPTYPPLFYWWKNFVYGHGNDELQRNWEKYQWKTYLKSLETKRIVLIGQLQREYLTIMKSQPPPSPPLESNVQHIPTIVF